MINELKNHWKEFESQKQKPVNIRNVIEIQYKELSEIILNNNKLKIKNLINNLYEGDFLIIKKSCDSTYLNKLKEKLNLYAKETPSKFHKMVEGCSNFHRFIGEDLAKKYSVMAVRHSFYFFRWNADENKIFDKFNKLWGNIKILGGLKFNEYVENTPKDIIVDRIQVVRYPEKTGFIEPHQHDPINQRLIISVYMSKKGEDFHTGGTFFYNNNKKVEVEDRLNVGDCGVFYATLKHSVDSVTLNSKIRKTQNENIRGRWWIGLYSPESNHIENRHTSNPLK